MRPHGCRRVVENRTNALLELQKDSRSLAAVERGAVSSYSPPCVRDQANAPATMLLT